MFGKGKSLGEDWRQPLQRSAIASTAATLRPSKPISSIGLEMTVTPDASPIALHPRARACARNHWDRPRSESRRSCCG